MVHNLRHIVNKAFVSIPMLLSNVCALSYKVIDLVVDVIANKVVTHFYVFHLFMKDHIPFQCNDNLTIIMEN
mgnify:CR=1 FL=1